MHLAVSGGGGGGGGGASLSGRSAGAGPGFFLGGGAPVRNDVTDFLLLQNTSCIRKPQVISGGRGCAPPAASP